MKASKIIIALLAALPVLPSAAHESQDHDAPKTLRPPKGGVIKTIEDTPVEVVAKGKDLKIYVYNKDLSPAPTSEFQIIATAELPREKKKDAIPLEAGDYFFSGTYDAKKSHRYNLNLAVTSKKTSKTNQLMFTVEPRK